MLQNAHVPCVVCWLGLASIGLVKDCCGYVFFFFVGLNFKCKGVIMQGGNYKE